MIKWLKKICCDWTHGGGEITRDINGSINWQCSECGRWAIAVDQKTEDQIIQRAINKAMKE